MEKNSMITVNSISGGQTSAYIAANYPADYNLFSLVTTDDKNCLFPDKKIRQEVSDRIGKEFIGTLEMDTIIYTMLDLEQFIGQEITWVSGLSFDRVVNEKGGWLPNKLHRYCTVEMKLTPMFYWWHENIKEPVEMRIGFRANEQRRVKNMRDRLEDDGHLYFKGTVSKHPNGRNKWEMFKWQKPVFPLLDDKIFKDHIVKYWHDKPVRFAALNNCVGCFHRNEVLLKKMFNEHPNKMQWFADQEKKENKGFWRAGGTRYEDIKNHKTQIELSFDDFSECDTGYCGL